MAIFTRYIKIRNMIKNIVFDFGAVLLDWNPHYVFDPYFGGDREKSDWFLSNICDMKWNSTMDAGKPYDEAVAERVAKYPEWEEAICLYRDRWIGMMGGQIEGMYELLESLKAAGYGIYGLSNWALETFNQVRNVYPILKLLDGMVISGEEHVIKPDPKIYRILLGRYSLNPAECLFVDDVQANVDGAVGVGMNAVRFTGCRDLREYFAKEGILNEK